MAYTINNILFATNSFVLNDASKTILKQFSKFLSENKGIEILIQGHTDDVGDAEKNKSLSQERANAVKNFLIELGIAGERLESKGYGSSLPKVSNTSDENKAINRRTDFLIKKIR
jgi:outer membrane protein OmpA-like peptidoglycan-associated protein